MSPPAASLARAAPRTRRPAVALRHGGVDMPPGAFAALLDAATATGRLLVLVPEAGTDEHGWLEGSETTGATYAERLRLLLGWTPVPTRLDAGPPAAAGLELAATLQRLVEAWPVPVERIVVLAAGGGALAVRAACAVRIPGTAPWTDRLSEVIGLGAPRYGVGPTRLSTEAGRRLDERLAGIVVAERAFLDLRPATAAHHLLIDETVGGPYPLGAALGRLLWWRHRHGRRRRVVDLFPTAVGLELAPGAPLTNRVEVHDALLHWLR